MDSQSKNFIGAGVLLYDYLDGVPVFLLGKEYRPNEVGKHRHGTYSDFGGHANVDEDPCSTALRELNEETLGLISIKREEGVPLESYCFRDYPKSYYIFLARYPFQEAIVKDYNEGFSLMEKEGLIPSNLNGLYEKSEFRWFTIPEIIAEKDNMRKPFYFNFLQIIKIKFAPYFNEIKTS